MTTRPHMPIVPGILLLLCVLPCWSFLANGKGGESPPVPQTDRNAICTEMQQVLDRELSMWYPLCLDTTCGGYYSDINFKWELEGPQDKMVVTQARHVWSTANAAMFYQKDNVLRNAGAHGVEFLRDKMWDQEYGGFYDLVSREGEPRREDGQIVKRAYGNAFAIYGLAAYYAASGDAAALKLAKEGFAWLEKHSHDPIHGGYFQFMSRDGTPFTSGYGNTPPKDQNSTIHLLESFTELYRVWPDPLLQERLHSLLRIVRDTITNEKGYMTLFFQRNWSPVSLREASPPERQRNYEFDHVSFGHDIEVAYLMLEASEALASKNDTTTLRRAKTMVDHVLRNGWDEQRGGIFDGGYYFPGQEKPSIVRRTKEWWAQVEAFNSLLIMSELFPSDPMRYYDRFCDQWEYCKNYVIDSVYGGWYWGGADIVPSITRSAKGSIWKADYHTSRGLINCIRRLKGERIHRGNP